MLARDKIAYLAGDGLTDNVELVAALKELQLEPRPFIEFGNGSGVDCATSVVIFEEFNGVQFDVLRRSNKIRMYGVPAILESVQDPTREPRLPIIHSAYPIYCRHLRNCRVAVTGVRNKDELLELRRFILYMDGAYTEKGSQFTHLVADKVSGEKYRDAVALGRPILKPEWIKFLWSHRNDKLELPTHIDEYRVKAFHKCNIAFEGFESTEKADMAKLVEPNGGLVVEADDPTTTHIVKAVVVTLPVSTRPSLGSVGSSMCTPTTPSRTMEQMGIDDDLKSPKKRPRFELYVINDLNEDAVEIAKGKDHHSERRKVMKVEWFWSSIQIEACAAEADYLFYDPVKSLDDFGNTSIGAYGNSFTSPISFALSDTDGGTPTSGGGTPQSIGRRKRKRRDLLSQLAAPDYPRFITDIPEDVETADLGGKSLGQIPTDISDAVFAQLLKDVSEFISKADYKSMSPRQSEFTHLLQTERNYVYILMSIVKSFKEPLENANQPGGRILDEIEIKTIFGTLIPIFALHRQVLRDMVQLHSTWNETSLVGKVFCDHSSAFRNAYEPFVNFFESTKAEIARCRAEKHRFKAFLQILQGRPEFEKQALEDLIIRPIQRLPSTALILGNLRKHTPEDNPDHKWIIQALEAMTEVNKGINEEKRVTEKRIAMFDLYNEIEGFPTHLVSARRILAAKIECKTLNSPFSRKHDNVAVLVFNDHIQFARRLFNLSSSRGLAVHASVINLRSPGMSRKSMMGPPMNSFQVDQSSKYKYKFLEKVEMEEVKRVIDVTDLPGLSFALIVRAKDETRERVLVFEAEANDINKWTKDIILTTIAKQIANYLERIDYSTMIAQADTTQLSVQDPETVLRKVKNKVTRALSFSKSPHKMKRTFSTLASPFSSSKLLNR